MSGFDIIVIALLVTWFAFAVRYIIQSKKKGHCCGCSGCSSCNGCASAKKCSTKKQIN